MERNYPDWFVLIENWVTRGGAGYTLPFLVGARARKSNYQASLKDARSLLEEMFRNPSPEQTKRILLTFCDDLCAPVFGLYRPQDEGQIRGDLCDQVFVREDVFERLNVLDHNNTEEIIEKLLIHSREAVEQGLFSRTGSQWTEFTQDEITRIDNLLEN